MLLGYSQKAERNAGGRRSEGRKCNQSSMAIKFIADRRETGAFVLTLENSLTACQLVFTVIFYNTLFH